MKDQKLFAIFYVLFQIVNTNIVFLLQKKQLEDHRNEHWTVCVLWCLVIQLNRQIVNNSGIKTKTCRSASRLKNFIVILELQIL